MTSKMKEEDQFAKPKKVQPVVVFYLFLVWL